MANIVDQNPLILDTAAATNVVTGDLAITKIRWVFGNPPADGDSVVLKDAAGKTIYTDTVQDVGTAAVQVVSADCNFIPPLEKKGLAITTLTDGVVYIYYEGPVPLKTT
jgi:hypothetical protein